jgi:antitoxin component HigA of HigAB toxin-antitoxin module
MELIREFPLRRIKSGAEHARAARMVLRLSTGKRDRGAAEYLDVLVDLIADYEHRSGQTLEHHPISAADLVRHRMEERGVSMSAVAKQIGIAQSNLSEMLSGKRDWSKSAIRGLSKLFNIRAERFLA